MLNVIRYGKILLLIAFTGLLQQCKLYKNPENTSDLAKQSLSTKFEIPEYWETEVNDVNQDSMNVVENWYKKFNDSHLNKLVEEAIDTSNLTILYQLALIDASIASSNLAFSRKNIQIGYSGDYSGFHTSQGTNDYNFAATGGISWEADLWGEN